MNEDEYNVVTLRNGVKYTESYRITDGGNTYVFLVNLDNAKDYCIKRVIKKNDKEFVTGLSNEDEYNKVLSLFAKEYLS